MSSRLKEATRIVTASGSPLINHSLNQRITRATEEGLRRTDLSKKQARSLRRQAAQEQADLDLAEAEYNREKWLRVQASVAKTLRGEEDTDPSALPAQIRYLLTH